MQLRMGRARARACIRRRLAEGTAALPKGPLNGQSVIRECGGQGLSKIDIAPGLAATLERSFRAAVFLIKAKQPNEDFHTTRKSNSAAHWLLGLATIAAFLNVTPSAFSAGDSKDKHHGNHAIMIVDQNGRISAPAPPSPAGQTATVMVGQAGLTFTPNALTIAVGDTVHWVWASNNHTVTSGAPCTADSTYCSPANSNCASSSTSNTGATYDHTFTQAGNYSYFCRIHCSSGMTGTIHVVAPFVSITSVNRASNGHFIISGQTVPNASVTLQASPDLVTMFTNLVPPTTTATNTGAFQYDDGGAATLQMRFYRATYP